jgi:hypothetical protein
LSVPSNVWSSTTGKHRKLHGFTNQTTKTSRFHHANECGLKETGGKPQHGPFHYNVECTKRKLPCTLDHRMNTYSLFLFEFGCVRFGCIHSSLDVFDLVVFIRVWMYSSLDAFEFGCFDSLLYAMHDCIQTKITKQKHSFDLFSTNIIISLIKTHLCFPRRLHHLIKSAAISISKRNQYEPFPSLIYHLRSSVGRSIVARRSFSHSSYIGGWYILHSCIK